MSHDARFSIDPESKPYNHLDFRNDPEEFQFAVLADNAGGARPGVVAAGLQKLDLLQPEFVVNLGDLIEGYMDEKDHTPATVETYRDWWAEWDRHLEALDAPFFYVPGNHDLNNPASVQVWTERFGGTRCFHDAFHDGAFGAVPFVLHHHHAHDGVGLGGVRVELERFRRRLCPGLVEEDAVLADRSHAHEARTQAGRAVGDGSHGDPDRPFVVTLEPGAGHGRRAGAGARAES